MARLLADLFFLLMPRPLPFHGGKTNMEQRGKREEEEEKETIIKILEIHPALLWAGFD